MQISVIIPVYNAEKFLENAVDSALGQPETAEVILVEDNSPDDALKVCEKLTQKHKKVRLFRHPNGENRGAGASRNLGIKKAKSKYIAFLDADDWYCKKRFRKTKEVFEKHPEADGVYEAVGAYFQDEEAEKQWFEKRNFTLTTLNKSVPPKELFGALALQDLGFFCTDGVTVKKDMFEKTGYFDTELKTSQDTHMWLKLSVLTELQAGEIKKPVAMRRVHAENRWSKDEQKSLYYKQLTYKKLLFWSEKQNLSLYKQSIFNFLSLFTKAKSQQRKTFFVFTKLFLQDFFRQPKRGVMTLFVVLVRVKNRFKQNLLSK